MCRLSVGRAATCCRRRQRTTSSPPGSRWDGWRRRRRRRWPCRRRGSRSSDPLAPTPRTASRSSNRPTAWAVPSCSFAVEIVRRDPSPFATRNAPPAPCTATSSPATDLGLDSCDARGRPIRRRAPTVSLTWSTSHRVAALEVNDVGRTPSLLTMAIDRCSSKRGAERGIANRSPAHLLQLSHAAYLVGRKPRPYRLRAYRRLRPAVRTTRCWQTPTHRRVSSASRTGIPAPSCSSICAARRAAPRSRHPPRWVRSRVREPATGSVERTHCHHVRCRGH